MIDLRFSYLAEFIIVIGCAGIFVGLLIKDQYLYQIVSESHNFTSNKSTKYCLTNATTMSDQEKVVADETSEWQLYISIFSGLPAVISAILLISWSDKIGRKVAMFLPLLGHSICNTMMVFIVKFSLPPYMVVISFFISGLTGSSIGLLNACITYLSDVVQTNDQKLRRFLLAECAMGIGGGILSFATGFWINEAGFFPSMCLAAACCWIATCLVPFLPTPPVRKNYGRCHSNMAANQSNSDDLSGSRNATSERSHVNAGMTKFSNSTILSRLKLIWLVYTTESSTCVKCELAGFDAEVTQCQHARIHRIWRMWFYLIAFIIYSYQFLGIGMIDAMYFVAYPLCFTPLYLGIEYSLLCISIGLAPLVVVFLKFVRCRNGSIIILGITVALVINLAIAFSENAVVVFIVSAFNVLCQSTRGVMRTQISSVCSRSEQGSAFGLVSGAENLTNMLANITYLLIFPATLQIFHGFIFLFSAGVLVIPLFLMAFIWVADKRRELPEHRKEGDASPLMAEGDVSSLITS